MKIGDNLRRKWPVRVKPLLELGIFMEVRHRFLSKSWRLLK
jgi:hypothetical protein